MTTRNLTFKEICARLHIAEGTGRNRLSRQYPPMPPYYKVGRKLLFPEDQFELWLKTYLVRGEER